MKLMPSCLEASRLMSRAQDEPLGLVEQALLRVHLSMCASCAHVQRQLDLLRGLSRALFADESEGVSPQDSTR